jgi:hypothetical protein
METKAGGPSTTPEGQSDQQNTEISKGHGDDKRAYSLSSEEERPPLPPRPETIDLLDEDSASRPSTARPHLQSQATTALSLKDISRQANSETVDTLIPSFGRTLLGRGLKARTSLSQLASTRGSEAGDTASIRSFIANSEEGQDESIFGDFSAEAAHQVHTEKVEVLSLTEFPQDDGEDEFVREFEPIGELDETGDNEGMQFFSNI